MNFKTFRLGLTYRWHGSIHLSTLLPGGSDADAGFSSLGNLSKLPRKLLALILDAVPDYVDLLCFSLTHNIVFELGYRNLVSRFIASSNAEGWAGDRIVCLSDATAVESLPPSIFTTSEYDTLRAWSDSNVPDGRILTYFQSVAGFHEPEFDASCGVRDICGPESWQRIVGLGASKWPTPERWKLLELLLIQHYMGFCYWQKPETFAEDPWVLCNLSKRIYIRTDAKCLPWYKPRRQTKGAGIMEQQFIDVLTMKTVCAQDFFSDHVALRGNFGEWAGDRFEITTISRLRPGVDGEAEWEDVTGRVEAELA